MEFYKKLNRLDALQRILWSLPANEIGLMKIKFYIKKEILHETGESDRSLPYLNTLKQLRYRCSELSFRYNQLNALSGSFEEIKLEAWVCVLAELSRIKYRDNNLPEDG